MRRLLLLVTVIACLLPVAPVAAAPAAPPRPQGTPPAGFTDSLVVGGIYQPTAVAAMPDGRALVLQKEGQVRVILGGAMLPDPAMTLSVCAQSERGLLGVALDPNFGVNGFVYIYYTRPSAGAPGGCVNR
ncbi:MAG: PQQ-dependent sugar dehydrogenase, partial [Actinomycetota bacterium]|nr:PQQ-dependent sugar dehydrogenase [Actinomycetota bacterium]